MSKYKYKPVDRVGAIGMLALRRQKGHNRMDAVKVLEANGGLLVGILDYIDMETVLIPEHMSTPYKTFSNAVAALGALPDGMSRGEQEQKGLQQ